MDQSVQQTPARVGPPADDCRHDITAGGWRGAERTVVRDSLRAIRR